MEYQKAIEILGIAEGDTPEDVRRKYHKLVAQIHPDVDSYAHEAYLWDITEVNAAYAYLIREGRYQPAEKPKRPDIDYETGEYYWNHEEGTFDLFLKNMLRAVEHLIEKQEQQAGCEFDEKVRFEAKKELFYLLVCQFTDIEYGLDSFCKSTQKDRSGNTIYYMPASLEMVPGTYVRTMAEGQPIFPLRMKQHRLYLGKEKDKELGYLSFPDDRMYYVLIPMLENREIQVRITAADKPEIRKNHRNYIPLHLWVRKINQKAGLQEDYDTKIDRVLQWLARQGGAE